MLAFDLLKRVFAIRGNLGKVAFFLHGIAYEFSDGRLIVDDEDASGVFHCATFYGNVNYGYG